MTLQPGIHPNIPAQRYHADELCDVPTLNRGIAEIITKQSPAHAHCAHPRFGGVATESTKAMDRGSVIHELLLKAGGGIAVAHYDSWRTDASKAFREAAVSKGQTPILAKDYDDAKKAVDAIRKRLDDRGLDAVCRRTLNEVTLIYGDNGVLCRTRLDALEIEEDLHRACIYDFKTCPDASFAACEKKIGEHAIALQERFNTRSLEVLRTDLAGRIKFVLLFMEVEPPYALQTVQLSGAWREVAGRQYRRALEIWQQCLTTGQWPDYQEMQFAEPRPWELAQGA